MMKNTRKKRKNSI